MDTNLKNNKSESRKNVALYSAAFIKTNGMLFFSPGLDVVIKERLQQIFIHGRTIELDVKNNVHDQLIKAAQSLAEPIITGCERADRPCNWDDNVWQHMLNKPHQQRLIIAAALFIAAYDRQEAITKEASRGR